MSKIKLVPVPNITKRELMTALLAGRKFALSVDSISNPLHWDDNQPQSSIRLGMKPWNWRGMKYLHEIVEQQWYEDPEMIGKPVKVRDFTDTEWFYFVFFRYDKDLKRPYCAGGTTWKCAEPVTAADLYQEQV